MNIDFCIHFTLFLFLILIQFTTSLDSLFSNVSSSSEDIIAQTVKENPKNLQNFLPVFSKILTKSGLYCDFPYLHDNIEYTSQCTKMKNMEGKQFCKVNFKESEITRLQSKIREEISLLDQNTLIKIKDDFYSECLNVNSEELFLSHIVERDYTKYHNIKRKILVDLYSDIKLEIKAFNHERVNLLFELSENHCKNTKFDYDCINENLILPITKTPQLKYLTDKLFKVLQKYKIKLKQIVEMSVRNKFRFREYSFIVKDNLNFHTIMNNSTDSLETLINSPTNFGKFSFKQFMELMIYVFEICTEECKSALEFLFLDNFGDSLEKIKLEIICKLFNISQIEEDVIENQIYNFKKDVINYKGKQYPLNPNIQAFLNHKAWSTRYLLAVLYRYIIMEQIFYREIINNEMKVEDFHKILFTPTDDSLEEKDIIKVLRKLPLVQPYYSFAINLHQKILNLYKVFLNTSNQVYTEWEKTNSTLSDASSFLEKTIDIIMRRVSFMKGIAQSQIDKINVISKEMEKLSVSLNDIQKTETHTYQKLKLENEINNLDYIANTIYKTEAFSETCHKFLLIDEYYDKTSRGKPHGKFISLPFDSYFFQGFENDVEIYYIHGVLLFNYPEESVSITINTNSEIDFLVSNKHMYGHVDEQVNADSIFENSLRYTYQYTSPKESNSYRDFVIKGNFPSTLNSTKRMIEMKVSSNKNTTNYMVAKDKCQDDSLQKVSICFNSHEYKIDCELGCKYLTDDYSNYIEYKEKVDKFERNRYSINHYNSRDQPISKSQFINTCQSYCKSFLWDIPIYKCLKRNSKTFHFDASIIKCGGLKGWELIARNTQTNSWFNEGKLAFINGANDLLLGNHYQFDNSGIHAKPEYYAFINSYLMSPLSNITFVSRFDFNKISDFLFTTGDMKYFVSVNKYSPFIKGFPYIAFSNFNNRMLKKHNYTNIFDVPIFNPIVETDSISTNGIFIYTNKKENALLYSDNTKINIDKNVMYDALMHNNGANVYIREPNACLLSKSFSSNFMSQELNIEPALLTTYIFAYMNSHAQTVFVPDILNKKVLLLRTNSFTSAYSLNLKFKSKIYLAIENTRQDNFLKNAGILLSNGWTHIDGAKNTIEVITSDIGDDILSREGNLNFFECQFTSNINPICEDKMYKEIERIKMSVFYKEFNQGGVEIGYSFFDFDDLFASFHLLMLQPLSCEVEYNSFSSNEDLVDNYLKVIDDYLPTFNAQITFKNTIAKQPTVQKMNIASKAAPSNNSYCDERRKKISDFFVFLQVNQTPTEIDHMLKMNGNNTYKYITQLKTLTNHTDYILREKPSTKFGKKIIEVDANRTFSEPIIRINNIGCILALDFLGNLYYKHLSNVTSMPNGHPWTLLKKNIFTFDLNDNMIIIVDYSYKVSYVKSYSNNDICEFQHWRRLKIPTNLHLRKISLSMFNCFWTVNDEGEIYFANGIDFFSNKGNETVASLVKYQLPPTIQMKRVQNIYQYADQVYFNTGDVIYKKEKTFNFKKEKCEFGEEFKRLTFPGEIDTKIKVIKKQHMSGYAIIDDRGKLYYRKNQNEVHKFGIAWEEIRLPKRKLDPIDDFDYSKKDIVTITSQGKVIILNNVNFPIN